MCYGWGVSEVEELHKASLLLAADVIYSDDLTDAFFRVLEAIMSNTPDKVLYIALEKRYNFTIDDLDVVANGYSHFRSYIKDGEEEDDLETERSCSFIGRLINLEEIPQEYFAYFDITLHLESLVCGSRQDICERERYFPNSTILEAKLGNNPSFTWRSIIATKDIIKRGARWRVGTGQNINIWTDPWIPRSFCFKVVLHTFLPMDSDAILGIPTSRFGQVDKWVWHHTDNGLFSVRGAYFIAKEIEEEPHARPSSNRIDCNWNFIWNVVIRSKIQMFAWKACFNAIPTAKNLETRLGYSISCCPHCGEQQEDIGHVLLKCHSLDSVGAYQTSVGQQTQPGTKTLWNGCSEFSKNLTSMILAFFSRYAGCYGGPGTVEQLKASTTERNRS
ncbi:UNVERIFIED_CONTAM: Methyltransferase-like protein 22 [Sesamum latifolium]|uniref:Methyltransferase-like protein 22 n=1 Tax=Sesamum latifolium TaxID=2727402 RepID=A0AAW2UEB8_9LAMI